MTKKVFAVSAVLLISWTSTSPLVACGDKNSNAARGIWRELGPAGQHEPILIVLSPEVKRALPRLSQIEADLRTEGYNPTITYRPDELPSRLKEEWKLVVAGPTDANAVAAAQGSQRILLIALGASKEERKEAKKKYAGVITNVANGTIADDVADALEASLNAIKKANSLNAIKKANSKKHG